MNIINILIKLLNGMKSNDEPVNEDENIYLTPTGFFDGNDAPDQ